MKHNPESTYVLECDCCHKQVTAECSGDFYDGYDYEIPDGWVREWIRDGMEDFCVGCYYEVAERGPVERPLVFYGPRTWMEEMQHAMTSQMCSDCYRMRHETPPANGELTGLMAWFPVTK